jgi:cobalamin biosynthesis Mg chelatase CobN
VFYIAQLQAFTEYCLSTPEILSWMQYVGDVPEAVAHETVKSETVTNGSVKSSSSSANTAPSNTATSTTAAAAAAGSSDAAVAVAVQKDVTRRRLRPPGGLAGGYTAATDLEGGQVEAAAIEARGSVSTSSTASSASYFKYLFSHEV